MFSNLLTSSVTNKNFLTKSSRLYVIRTFLFDIIKKLLSIILLYILQFLLLLYLISSRVVVAVVVGQCVAKVTFNYVSLHSPWFPWNQVPLLQSKKKSSSSSSSGLYMSHPVLILVFGHLPTPISNLCSNLRQLPDGVTLYKRDN